MTRVHTTGMIWRTLMCALGLTLCVVISGRAAAPDEDGLDVVKVRKNFYMIAGAGGNIGVQIGSDGIVLVNAGTAAGVRPGAGARSRS